ncbi:glycoside hydrolase family 95-like protein [Hamadaea sp. NPDC050747]|uniref:glycoside hydrolase family 95-like protein n=1 Tax=Hamadaea sp. NPDC050747 TaxID=3155789 RepID=UPI0033FEAD0A
MPNQRHDSRLWIRQKLGTFSRTRLGTVARTPTSFTILPALPAGWTSGKAREPPARGGGAVDLEWWDRVLSSVVLNALATREVH